MTRSEGERYRPTMSLCLATNRDSPATEGLRARYSLNLRGCERTSTSPRFELSNVPLVHITPLQPHLMGPSPTLEVIQGILTQSRRCERTAGYCGKGPLSSRGENAILPAFPSTVRSRSEPLARTGNAIFRPFPGRIPCLWDFILRTHGLDFKGDQPLRLAVQLTGL